LLALDANPALAALSSTVDIYTTLLLTASTMSLGVRVAKNALK
jgi:hypothetical protein